MRLNAPAGAPLQQDGAQLAPDGLRIGSLSRRKPAIDQGLEHRSMDRNEEAAQLVPFALSMLERLDGAGRAATRRAIGRSSIISTA
jgi:hypothetical protein